MSPLNTKHIKSKYFRKKDLNLELVMDHSTPLLFDEGLQRIRSSSTVSDSNSRFTNSERQEFPLATSTRFQVHDRFQNVFGSYDKEMLLKLDFKKNYNDRTPPSNRVKSQPSSNLQETIAISRKGYKQCTQLRSLSISDEPIQTKFFSDSSSQRQESTRTSSCYQTQEIYDTKLNIDLKNFGKLTATQNFVQVNDRLQVANDSSKLNDSHQNSSKRKSLLEHEDNFREEKNLRKLKICENNSSDICSHISASGKKRRASSPTRKDNLSSHFIGSSNSLFRRRESVTSRNPAGPSSLSNNSSIFSTTPDNKNNSSISTLSSITGSRTSFGSAGRLSPEGTFTDFVDDIELLCTTSRSSNTSGRGSFSKTVKQKITSESRPHVIMTMQASQSDNFSNKVKIPTNSQGIFTCECCSKKPKKFDTKDELDAHEQEKQYECAYCRNRFKNKNEAERHQNSLHLRRQSWSCAALSGYAAAFHNSISRPGKADTCGYCGEDFSRSGIILGTPFITNQDWKIRITHLTKMHKFGECNHTKKFFRADHFRQHLKHTHGGTSGKWTNILENSCMRDEPLPNPIHRPEKVSSDDSKVSNTWQEKKCV